MRALSLGVALLLVSCRDDSVTAPTNPDVGSVFWALRLEERALTVSLAAGAAVGVEAVPITSQGQALEGLGQPTYISGNADVVRVGADGRITPLAPTAGVQVIARLTAAGITHADTATISITADPPAAPASLSLQPVAPDSAKFALGGSLLESFRTLRPVVLDAGGSPVEGLLFFFESLDPTIAKVDRSSGSITGVRPGRVRIAASALAFGVPLRDTVDYRIGLPLVMQVLVLDSITRPGPSPNYFRPSRAVLGVGGVAHWWNTYTDELIDIVFDDPTHVGAVPEYSYCALGAPCGAGNVPPFGPETGDDFVEADVKGHQARRFNAPGTYRYRSTLFGTEAVVEVVDERE
jgi:hypothetical protein